jgi:hypothetical protein
MKKRRRNFPARFKEKVAFNYNFRSTCLEYSIWFHNFDFLNYSDFINFLH